MFRTQGGDFGHPYDLDGKAVERCREYSRDLWLNNRWPGQVRPLRWLVEKFAPYPVVEGRKPAWTPEEIAKLPTTLHHEVLHQ
jgi:hypothetical protein